MFTKILVPLDSSDLAEYALPPAIRLAEQGPGTLTLLHVLEHQTVIIPEGPDLMGHNMYYPETSLSREETAGREYLAGLNFKVGQSEPTFTWHTRLEEGDPASRIVDVAEEEAIDLIVMSTHGYSGVTRWVLGSVAEKVLRYAPCPVLIVRDDIPMRHLLITLDGSKLAESGLPIGMSLAQAFAADVTLLRVDDDSDRVKAEDVVELNKQEHGLGERFRQGLYEQAGHYLENVAHQHHRDDVPIHTAVRYGKPAQAILNFAEEHDVDLIVMSTHGRTGLARWRYGSITEKVLRSADCALLISRPDFGNQ